MINYKEIFNAWKTSFNPTPLQRELAEKRLNVCIGCEFKKDVIKNKEWSSICGSCGCPLSKKIFTSQTKSCPLSKWDIVDMEYTSILKISPKHLI